MGPIGERLSVWDVLDGVASLLFDVDLEAHDPVLSQVLVSLGATWSVLARRVFKKHIERLTFDGLPSEETVRAGQHESEAEERLCALVRSVAEFVLVELRGLYQITFSIIHEVRLRHVDFNFAATTPAPFVVLHLLVELEKSVRFWSGSNVEHEAEFGLDILADALEEPLVRVDFSVVPMFDGEHEIYPAGFQNVGVEAEVPRSHLEDVQNV